MKCKGKNYNTLKSTAEILCNKCELQNIQCVPLIKNRGYKCEVGVLNRSEFINLIVLWVYSVGLLFVS